MTTPAARNRRHLKKACVNTWNREAEYPETPAAPAPNPSAHIMRPSCDKVEKARMRLRSVCAQATTAENRAVTSPTPSTVRSMGSQAENRGKKRAVRYTPATTMVAEWMRAETGVGPSMASGSQTCSGNMADFPQAPAKRHSEVANRRLKVNPPADTGRSSAAIAAGALRTP